MQPTTGHGALIWHALGAKTLELIHEHVHVEAVRDDLDEIVVDAELLEAILGTPDPEKKAKEIKTRSPGACANMPRIQNTASFQSVSKA